MTREQEQTKGIFQYLKKRISIKDAFVFLFFFIIAGVFWYIQARDQKREATLYIPVEYTGIPDNVRVTNELPKQIIAVIKDEGKVLLQYNRREKKPIIIDLKYKYAKKGKKLITSEQIKNQISKYLFSGSSLLEIKPDSIPVEYTKLSSKKLPVRLNSSIKLASQYLLSDSIQIKPTTVKVFGPKNIIDSMREVKTEEIKLRSLSDTTELVVKLEKPTKELNYSFDEVTVKLFVEQFTEKKIEKHITIINAPKEMNIRLFPPTVTVIYNVGLSKYDKINESNIKVFFDYAETKEMKKRRYSLKVSNNSPFVHNLRVLPERVEFLLEETNNH